MKFNFTYLYLPLFFSLFTVHHTYGQVTFPPDTTKQVINAGFDVIIKKNGDIVYGLVKEVDEQLIRYQRTDIPEGPIYTMRRNEVYAISYRNQVKDFLDAPKDTAKNTVKDTVIIHDTVGGYRAPSAGNKPQNVRHSFSLQNGNVRFGLGFIRSYTGVNDPTQYSSSGSFPIISIAYEAPYQDQIYLGLQLAFGHHKFSKQEYSNYDSVKTNVLLKENIFTLHAYGRYSFLKNISALQPYVLGGIGINTSHINTEHDIKFINNPNDAVLVKSGTNSVSIGIMARIGTEYSINNNFRVFGDVGIGASILSIGISANID